MASRIKEGYILIDRNILDWGWAKTPVTAWLFVIMIVRANYKDMKFHDRIIKRGQFVTSLKSLANMSGCTLQQVRTAILHLKSTQEITIETTPRYTVITIVKYDEYQKTTRTSTQTSTNKQQTDNTLITQSNTYNNKDNKGQRNKKGRFAPVPPSGYGDLTYADTMPPLGEGTVDDIPEGMRGDFETYDDYWRFRNR